MRRKNTDIPATQAPILTVIATKLKLFATALLVAATGRSSMLWCYNTLLTTTHRHHFKKYLGVY